MKNTGKKILSYTVFYQVDMGGYVAFAPFLPGCHSQCDSLEEAETNIKEAIEAYLESLAERGENFPLEEKTFSTSNFLFFAQRRFFNYFNNLIF